MWPETIFTLTEAMPKWRARALIMARFARPWTGGSFTETINSVSLTFSTFSSCEFGLALTLIFMVLNQTNDRLGTSQLPRQLHLLQNCRLLNKAFIEKFAAKFLKRSSYATFKNTWKASAKIRNRLVKLHKLIRKTICYQFHFDN